MKPKAIVALVVLCLFFLLFKAGAQEETIPPGEANAELEIVPEIPLAAATVPEFNVDPGITPDSPFYFIDKLLETGSDDPEKALEYKEEKIAEALVMAEEGKEVHAKEAFERAQKY